MPRGTPDGSNGVFILNLTQKAVVLSFFLCLSSFNQVSFNQANAEPTLPQVAHVESLSKTINLATMPDDYVSETSNGLADIEVRKAGDAASVFINSKEVIRFRTNQGNLSPYLRAKQVAYTLNQFLEEGGNTRDIKPGLEKETVVIRVGPKVLMVIDPKMAAETKQPERVLALAWANQLRLSLGADAIAREPEKIASRSLIGTLSRPTSFENLRGTGITRSGFASWYGPGFNGRRSSDGSRFDMNALTAAHPNLPFGTLVRVMNHANGRSCIVRITDRGPFVRTRIIDLSRGAASAIGMLGAGVAKVSIEVVTR